MAAFSLKASEAKEEGVEGYCTVDAFAMADADRVDAEQALHDQQEKERAMKKAMVERLKTKELDLHARDSRIAELEASLMQTQQKGKQFNWHAKVFVDAEARRVRKAKLTMTRSWGNLRALTA